METRMNLKKLAKQNEDFRKVLATGKKSQLVVMSLKKGEDIGTETHDEIDQMFFVFDGKGEAIVSGRTLPIEDYDLVFVPAGTSHNIRATSSHLKLATIYAPPAHPDATVQHTREEALAGAKH